MLIPSTGGGGAKSHCLSTFSLLSPHHFLPPHPSLPAWDPILSSPLQHPVYRLLAYRKRWKVRIPSATCMRPVWGRPLFAFSVDALSPLPFLQPLSFRSRYTRATLITPSIRWGRTTKLVSEFAEPSAEIVPRALEFQLEKQRAPDLPGPLGNSRVWGTLWSILNYLGPTSRPLGPGFKLHGLFLF